MSNPSNLYAEKVYSEHPLVLWALDDTLDYKSLISEARRNLATLWTPTNAALATSFEDLTEPFPDSHLNRIRVDVPVSETIEKGILSKFLISQGLQQSEGKEESRYLKLFFSNYEINFLKKINSLNSKENINNFKINFSSSKFLLEFTNDELSKLDGFEIKKN